MVIVVTGRRKRRDFKAVVIHTQRNATTLVAPILSAQMVENGTSLLVLVGGRERAISPTGYFREICGPPNEGYHGSHHIRKYLYQLAKIGELRKGEAIHL